MIKKILPIFIFILLVSCKSNFIENKRGTENIKINKDQFNRITDYFRGNFFSYELGQKILNSPLMFAISNDGKSSLILSCRAPNSYECKPGVFYHQIIWRTEKKEKKKLYIFAIGDKIVWKNYNYDYKNNEKLEKFLLEKNILDNKDFNKNNKYYDFSLLPVDDDGNNNALIIK